MMVWWDGGVLQHMMMTGSDILSSQVRTATASLTPRMVNTSPSPGHWAGGGERGRERTIQPSDT